MPENVTAGAPAAAHALRRGDRRPTDGEFGSNGAVEVATRLSAENGLYMPFQYGNPANPRAHYEGTAEEIVRDCPEIDVFVAGPRHRRHPDGLAPGASRSTAPRSRSSPASRCRATR